MPDYSAIIERLAAEWAAARAEVIAASIYPIGNEPYRAALIRLSNAEDALFRALQSKEGQDAGI